MTLSSPKVSRLLMYPQITLVFLFLISFILLIKSALRPSERSDSARMQAVVIAEGSISTKKRMVEVSEG